MILILVPAMSVGILGGCHYAWLVACFYDFPLTLILPKVKVKSFKDKERRKTNLG